MGAKVETAAACRSWDRDGYLVVRDAVPQACIARLREVCDAARDHWHAVASEDGEPGGFAPNPEEWVLIHLNHPRYHRTSPDSLAVLLDAIAQPLILELVGAIMQQRHVFCQANYYVEPTRTRNAGWHRDCQFYGGDEAAVKQRVFDEASPPRELHVHIPLASTAHTELVPGSHTRWDSQVEHQIRTEQPLSDEMPEAQRIALEPGDLAMFHVNSLHRGRYPGGVTRRTIAITFGSTENPRFATAEMLTEWRGYVCTYQPWFKQPEYLAGTAAGTQAFFQRFIDVYAKTWQPEFVGADWPEPRRRYFLPPYA